MELPSEFFTVQSMLTLSGATGATFVVSNGMQQAFNFNPKWLALLIALLIVELGVFLTGGTTVQHLVGVVNGFLVYSCAAGGTSMLGQGTPDAIDRGQALAPNRRRFLSPWF